MRNTIKIFLSLAMILGIAFSIINVISVDVECQDSSPKYSTEKLTSSQSGDEGMWICRGPGPDCDVFTYDTTKQK